MRIFFITGSMNESDGGGRATIRNYKALQTFADVDLYQVEKISTLHSLLSIVQGIYPPCLKRDIKIVLTRLKETQYDFVFVDRSFFGNIVKKIKKNGYKSAVFFHNCEHDYNRVRFGKKKNIKSVIYQYLVDKSEKKAVDYADIKLVFTLRDKKRIEFLYSTDIDAVIPVGLVDQYNKARKDEVIQESTYCLLFGPCMAANEEGYGWFVRNVSPYLTCKTVVAGKGFEKHIVDWSSRKVRVKGYVEDIQELYENAACVSIPLFLGGGMKIKTAEALMFGKYIFGTEEAFVGYDFDISQYGAKCDTSETFISEINGFLKSNTNNFNEAARNLYLQKYDMKVACKAFQKIFEK